jgi:methylenetetrahydrofolate--tRNA-(uracil-5-)-methyltransferase
MWRLKNYAKAKTILTGSIGMNQPVNVIGAGLAGCEAAHLLSKLGIRVNLYEMKPGKYTEAHKSSNFAELVCSNSLKSEAKDSAAGVLKREMRLLGSLLLRAADDSRVPAGKALAVDREKFAAWATSMIKQDDNIRIVPCELSTLDADAINILCTGPLTSQPLAESLSSLTGSDNMYFYDAIAPILEADSIDMEHAFWADRYSDAPGDYLNCPMNEDEYDLFYDELVKADKVSRREFENVKHFESCMPVEELASRGRQTLTFGPMRPVGLSDPKDNKRPFAVVQLRKEDVETNYLNMVGFQTRLKYSEQKRIFSLIPALHGAVFSRYGSIHRNTFINAPTSIRPDLSLNNMPNTFIAGQISGVEGYLESAAMGMVSALSVACRLRNIPMPIPGATTAMGALLKHLQNDRGRKFQPSNANFGLFEPLKKRHPKKQRGGFYSQRAEQDFGDWLEILPLDLARLL